MKCPNCKKEIEKVRVYSEAWQWATLKGKEIDEYGSIEEVLETICVECPECNTEIDDSIA